MKCVCCIGWAFVCQRPAGCSQRRVATGAVQPRCHGDSPSLHVTGGKRKGDHPACGAPHS